MFKSALKYAPLALFGLLITLAAGFGLYQREWEGFFIAAVIVGIVAYLYRVNGGKWML